MYAESMRKAVNYVLAGVLLLVAGCSAIQPRKTPLITGIEQTETHIQHWLTANGARVYYVYAPELPMLDVRVVFDAGSARDAAKPGLALLANGLMDQGAADLDADAIADEMEGLGARLGNGSARDMAWLTLRSLSEPQLLQPALDVFTKVLSKPRYEQADFERERQRLLVALQQEDQKPGDVAEKAFYKALYGDHPYASPESGTQASVRNLRTADLQAFYRQYYVARNAVVALVGDVDRAQAERIAEQITRDLAPGVAAAPLPEVADLTAPVTERIAHSSTQTTVLMGEPGISRTDPDYFTLYVGNHVLGGGGLVSRISEEVREKRGLSYSAYSYFLPMGRRGPFQLGLQTRNDQADEALQVLRDTLVQYREQGPTDEELLAAKRNITGGYPLRIDSNSKIVEYLAMIGFYGLPLDYLDRFNSRIEAVTREQVQDAFRRRVHPDRMATIVVGGAS